MNLLGGVGTVAEKKKSTCVSLAESKYSHPLSMFNIETKVASYWERYALNLNRSLTCEVNN